MRVLRITAGILTLLIALPVLAAGAVAWWAMQHRSPDGAFHAQLATIGAPNRVIVVPDVDAVLRRDAPIARAEQTTLELAAGEGAFVGMAAPADLAAYLTGISYTELIGTSLGRGPLSVKTREVASAGEPLADPQAQSFWVREGSPSLKWTPKTDRNHQLALIIVAPAEKVDITVAVTAAWLNSTTWGLLILGPVLLLLGLGVLAWPQRPREIVYVMNTNVAAQAGLPMPAVAAPVSWQSMPASPEPAQGSDDAPGAWPPPEAPATTEAPKAIPAQLELPYDPDRPMPTAGMQLHLTRKG
jgi:hypothetical protein